MSKHPEDHSEFLDVRRELDTLLYDIALLCHAGHIEQPQTGEIGEMLGRISEAHLSLQRAKSERFTSPDDMKRLRRIRRDETLALVRKVRRRQQYVDLPPGVSGELRKYDALSRRLETLIRDAPQHKALKKAGGPVISTPPSGSKARRQPVDDADRADESKPEVVGETEDDAEAVAEEVLHITGLDAVPDVGDPLDFLKLSPPPPSLRLWIKTKLDNADVWISEHRTLTIRAVKTIAIVLICFNLLAIHWFIMAAYDARSERNDPAVSGEMATDAAAEELSTPGIAASMRGAFGVLAPFLIVLGSLVAVWVCWDDKPKQYIRDLDLDKVKRTLIPFDPVNTAVESFWHSYWGGEAPSDAAVRERDQSLHAAQFLSTGLLVAVLLFPFAQTKVSAMSTVEETGEAAYMEANVDEAEFIGADVESESAGEGERAVLKDQLRRKYLWMTAVLGLLVGLSVLVMWLRQASAIGRQGAAYFGFTPNVSEKSDDGPTMVDVDDPEGKSLYGREDAEIDHEDPYGAMARSVQAHLSDQLLGRSLWIDVKIARYRLLNRWRFFYVIAFVIQHSFRFVGVMVFAGMLLISVVMPLVFLSAVQNQAKSEYVTFRALADPFLSDDAEDVLGSTALDRPLDDTAGSEDEAHAVRKVDRQGERVVEAQRHSRASLYYVAAVLILVLVNVGLAVARVLHRGRNWRVFRSVKGDLKGKAAFAGLGLMLAFLSWGDNMRFGELNVDFTNLHDEDGRVIAQVRSVREAVHLEQKAITEFLAPSAGSHPVWYVDSRRGSAGGDGTSWDRALSDLQAAIDRAAATGGGEVWVAAGVYRIGPSQHTDGSSTGAMLHVPGNVRVFGGFTGKSSLFPEFRRRERNWTAHSTVLLTSGQRGPETVGGRVLLEDGAVLDGFVFTNTEASQSGGIIAINPRQRLQKPSIIGNSRFLLFDGRRPLPLASAGGTTIVHNSQFAPGNKAWPQLNARVTVTAHCIVIPHPTLTK